MRQTASAPQAKTSVRRHMTDAGKRLAQAGVENPELCAQLLLCHCLGISRLECVVNADMEVPQGILSDLNQMLLRRISGEPLAYILGRKEFFSRDFRVTPDTLIPRPETELLVETILELSPSSRPLIFADIGTGSGCIGITLALERKLWRGILVDISPKALEVARYNAQKLDAMSGLTCLLADMYACPLKLRSCDLVASNPPYISNSETEWIMPEVRDFEPHTALFSPHNGTAHLKAVADLAAHALKPGGMFFVEHGAQQGQKIRGLLTDSGFFHGVKTLRDLAGLERCTYAARR